MGSDPAHQASPVDPASLFEPKFGFVPNLFQAQASLPRAVLAEAGMVEAVVLQEGALSRKVKELLVYAVAAARHSTYCATAHAHLLETLGGDPGAADTVISGKPARGLTDMERTLLEFGLNLGREPSRTGPADIQRCLDSGLSAEEVLEAILTVSLGRFMCVLAEGLATAPDFDPRPLPVSSPANPLGAAGCKPGGPHLPAPDVAEPPAFEPWAFFRQHFGFVPNIFKAQTLRPDVIRAEVEAIRSILLPEDLLPRRLKEYILLVVSSRNLNTYCVAVHCELLRGLGIPLEKSDQIALNHQLAGLPPQESALLDFVVSMHGCPEKLTPEAFRALQEMGWRPEQILEAIVMASLSEFLNTLQCGLGPVPDFPVRIDFEREKVNLPAPGAHPMVEPGSSAGAEAAPAVEAPSTPDPDAELVARSQAGDLGAFEELVVKHQAKIYKVLLGVTGNPESAADGAQEVFIRAMTKISEFRGTSKFSTWLTRIAINEGLERLRKQRTFEPLPEDDSEEAAFRPANISPWVDNPEEQLSRQETRQLVQKKISALPEKYRAALILRDVAQLPAHEAAAAMGLSLPTFKTRLLRGRLMLREALAPSFARRSDAEPTHA